MNDILIKVQKYLDNVSKGPTQVNKKLVEEFGEACKNALLKQFTEDRHSKFEPRMSNIGRPLCQLQMEAKGIKGEGQPYNVKMRNTFGDLIEALALFVMKSAGVNVANEQKKVVYKFGKTELKVDKMLRLIKRYGILKVHHHILLKKSLEKRVALTKLLRMIPLAMHHKDFYMEKDREKNLVDG